MKKIMKKAISLALVVAMSISVASCSSSNDKTTDNSDGNSKGLKDTTKAEVVDYSGGFEDTVTIKIPVYDRAFEGWNVTDNYYTKWIQKEFGDKYNVNVQYVSIGRTTEVADYMSMLAAGSAPTIIFHYDMPQAVVYYGEEALQPLDLAEIEKYALNYFNNMSDTIRDYGELDGQTYFLLAERQDIQYNSVTLIRQDWLDQVGADMPTNMEDLNEVFAQWKDAGLGVKGELLRNKSFNYDYAFRGENVDEIELALYSDLNVAPLTWYPTKEYLKNLNQLYNDGLVDPEFYLISDSTQAKSNFVAGKTGTYTLYMSSSDDTITSLVANNPDAEVSVLPRGAAAPSDSHPYYYKNLPFGMIMGINSRATEEERVATYMFLDWMSQPENLFFLQNGVEGENYNFDENGVAIPVVDFNGESKRSPNNNKDYWCLVAEVATYDTEEKSFAANRVNFAPVGYEYLIDDSYKDFNENAAQYGLYNTVYTTPLESSAEYAAELKALFVELYVDIATCKPEEFEAKYEAACEEYLDAGYQEILDEKQMLLDQGTYK